MCIFQTGTILKEITEESVESLGREGVCPNSGSQTRPVSYTSTRTGLFKEQGMFLISVFQLLPEEFQTLLLVPLGDPAGFSASKSLGNAALRSFQKHAVCLRKTKLKGSPCTYSGCIVFILDLLQSYSKFCIKQASLLRKGFQLVLRVFSE